MKKRALVVVGALLVCGLAAGLTALRGWDGASQEPTYSPVQAAATPTPTVQAQATPVPTPTSTPRPTPDPAWGKRSYIGDMWEWEEEKGVVRYSEEGCYELAARTLAAGGVVEWTCFQSDSRAWLCADYAGAPGCRLLLDPIDFFAVGSEPWLYDYHIVIRIEDASQLREGAVPPPEGLGKEYQTEENEKYIWDTGDESWYVWAGRALDYGLFEPGQEITSCAAGAATGRLYYNTGMGYYENLWFEGVAPGGD